MKSIDRRKFFDALKLEFPRPLTPGAIEGLGTLLSALESDSAISDVRWAAYMLATIKHECANAWQPITERGKTEYFQKYDTGTPLGTTLGNTEAGDGFRFRGRGYVQITGRANYARMSKQLLFANQLVEKPDLALQPDIAYRIMSYGMRKGSFTSRKLEQFISPMQCDYLNARRIINRLDKAVEIQDYATRLERALSAAGEVSVPIVSAA